MAADGSWLYRRAADPGLSVRIGPCWLSWTPTVVARQVGSTQFVSEVPLLWLLLRRRGWVSKGYEPCVVAGELLANACGRGQDR
jgi:hypothetical protein